MKTPKVATFATLAASPGVEPTLDHCSDIPTLETVEMAKSTGPTGTHSCAGQATQARDPKSFVMLPGGDCTKIAGGKTTAT